MSLPATRPIASFLEEQRARPLLKCITCGSVDDGKSTLIGRILLESKNIFDDQLKELERDSARYGTRGGEVDLALLVDGLKAEREQGITIDVAYRFFSTDRRRFIIADTPGHHQYTRNMATAASTADVAIVLIDAEQGISEQTRLHTRILALMAVEHVVLAINKMDLVAFDEDVFLTLEAAYRAFALQFAFKTIQAVPISGVEGDNVATTSANTLWYDGAPLLGVLEDIEPKRSAPSDALPFRLAVQWVNRLRSDFRGVCGTLDQGRLHVGDAVQIAPSGHRTTVRSVVCGFDEVLSAEAGEAVTVTLEDELDIGRGDILCAPKAPVQFADQFAVRLLWMNEKPLLPGRQYILKIHTKEVNATVTSIKHREDITTGAHLAAKDLGVNEVGVVNILTSEPIVYEPYTQSKSFGGFILIDKQSFETLGAGMIDFALRRSANTHWQNLEIDKALRAAAKNQTPKCLWFTGLSGSGKSTLANLLEKRLAAEGKHTYLLDGDNVRHGLNKDLGFSEADRIENIRRVAEVARLMVDAGLIVIVSFISPFTSDREMARSLFGVGEFAEIFVDTPIEVCESRDVKGLYAKARRGELTNFTGIDSAYEVPQQPDVVLSTAHKTPDECIDYLLSFIPLE